MKYFIGHICGYTLGTLHKSVITSPCFFDPPCQCIVKLQLNLLEHGLAMNVVESRQCSQFSNNDTFSTVSSLLLQVFDNILLEDTHSSQTIL